MKISFLKYIYERAESHIVVTAIQFIKTHFRPICNSISFFLHCRHIRFSKAFICETMKEASLSNCSIAYDYNLLDWFSFCMRHFQTIAQSIHYQIRYNTENEV